MVGREVTLAEAGQQVARVVEHLETVRWELLGIALSLRELPDDQSPDEQALDEQAAAEAELRGALECVLTDRIQPALGALRALLHPDENA
ncbi:MAG TPA: hypothetical protein VKK31_13260 [Thermoanaerobaculia bacterium]|nr:hypothetical protein [Thermoanaerobaculia bacterium]